MGLLPGRVKKYCSEDLERTTINKKGGFTTSSIGSCENFRFCNGYGVLRYSTGFDFPSGFCNIE